MTFTFSSRRRLKRQQRRFIERGFGHLPYRLAELIRSLPIEVTFKAYENRRGKCIYYQGRIYLPARFWKDQWRLARWMKRENLAFFLHECFHAVDLLHLSTEERDSLLEPFTGHATNAHQQYTTGPFPIHQVPDGTILARWFAKDNTPESWAQSAAELFADTGTETFTDLPPWTRSDEALKVTLEAKEAVYALLGT